MIIGKKLQKTEKNQTITFYKRPAAPLKGQQTQSMLPHTSEGARTSRCGGCKERQAKDVM